MQEPLQSHRVLDEVGVGGASNRQGFPILLARDTQIFFQSGEAVDSGLTVSSGASTVFKFGVSGRIKGSDMAWGQNGFSIRASLFWGFLAERLYLMEVHL